MDKRTKERRCLVLFDSWENAVQSSGTVREKPTSDKGILRKIYRSLRANHLETRSGQKRSSGSHPFAFDDQENVIALQTRAPGIDIYVDGLKRALTDTDIDIDTDSHIQNVDVMPYTCVDSHVQTKNVSS